MKLLHSQEPGEEIDPCTASSWWVARFRESRTLDWRIPWNSGTVLSDIMRGRIGRSIAEFQRGESSEALHYLARSEAFSVRTGDADFHEASMLFVREENEHAALLLRFMREVGIPAKTVIFSDGVFRWLRSFSDLGWSSRVLLIAELIAQEYYPCLHAATDHPALRRICDKIVSDEEVHIRFQVRRIVCLEAGTRPWVVRLREALQTVLMFGAACEVYRTHGHVLRMRMGFRRFVARAMRRSSSANRAMKDVRRSGGQLSVDG